MSNTFFQFKQFIVHQEHTAMKVCTDACLFGAWLSHDQDVLKASTLLDIGTGTGLLSLMVAQATVAQKSDKSNDKPVYITALEIEIDAANEAIRNIQLSPWSSHIEVINNSLQAFIPKQLKSNNDPIAENEKIIHDCIFTNPPFFEGDLQSPNAKKNLAAHSSALPWITLIEKVNNLLKEEGYYYVLIPAIRAYTMQKLAEQNGLKLVEEVVVFNTIGQKPFRVMQKYKKTQLPIKSVIRSNFTIKEKNQSYSNSFISLLKEYYLHL